MKNDIAIIGIAGRFPGAADLREFHRNLQSGKDCVGEIPASRFCDTNFPLGNERYQVMGLLDQIDRFDRKFFSVSPREAAQMDPHQRLMLEIAYEALEDSGYSPAAFNGTEMAVIAADADYFYLQKLPELEPSMYSGNAPFSIVGRLARFFNTTGPAFITDTGCSSALMGVTLACDQLQLGKASTALVLGARIVLEPLPVVPDLDLAITSNDGKTRSFNADSNGSGSSEAVGAVLLKPLEQALRDDDHVYAVIKATAVNASAQSSASLTATSSAAQSALLQKAWERAGVSPESISYIEAHGSGTKLGDPIEIAGIDLAYRKFTERKHICAVASVKSNIGHTDKVAGLCGLIKAALSLEKREMYPSIHFDRPNPLIDFANSATYINTEFKPWERLNGLPRRAGVNSFGFSGNNVHVVLEEAPPRPWAVRRPEGASVDGATGASTSVLVTLSSKRPGGIAANAEALRRHLEVATPAPELADVAFTLNTGREHFRHRAAVIAHDLLDLARQLQQLASAPAGEESAATNADLAMEPVLIFSDDCPVDPAVAAQIAERFPVFKRARVRCASELGRRTPTAAFERFAFQYSLYHLLAHLGLASENLVGVGAGDLVVQALLEELPLAEAIRECVETAPEEPVDLERRLLALIARQTEGARAAFVEVGAEGRLTRELRRLRTYENEGLFEVFALEPGAECVLGLIGRYHVAGGRFDWAVFHRAHGGRRISLPGYQFERTRCWYCPPHSAEAYQAWHDRIYAGGKAELPKSATTLAPPRIEARVTAVDISWTPTQQRVGRIWMEILKLDRVGLGDDFFALGGHSLFGTMVRNRIEQSMGLRLEFKDIFVHNTIKALAASIDRLVAAGRGSGAAQPAIPVVAAASDYPVSPAQFRLWLLDQKEGAMRGAYNVSVILRVSGPLDAERLATALQQVVARHEALRTYFIEVGGEARQVIVPAAEFSFNVERRTATEADVGRVVDEFIQPFDLARAPLVRAAIVRIDATSHVLALDIHHTLFDGTSYGLLFRDLGGLYRGESLPPLALTYKDYAAWRTASLSDAAMRESEAYWLDLFRAPPAPLELRTDFPRPAVRNFEGAMREAGISAGQLARLRLLAQQEGATLFMVLLAAYSTVLAKHSGQEDVVVGSSVAGRTHAELEPLVGLFVNTVAFRTAPRGELSFRDFLARVKENCIQTYKHQDYPFESLIQKLGLVHDRARNPLFDTMLVLQNIDLTGGTLTDGIELTPGEFVRRSAKFDLTLEFYEAAEGLMINLEYSAALFKPATIDKLASDLARVLEAACENPGVRLSAIELEPEAKLIAAEPSDFSFAEV